MTAAQAQALIAKLRQLSEEELRTVEDMVDSLRERKSEGKVPPESIRIAVKKGKLHPPTDPGVLRSVRTFEPVKVPGRPLSEIILEDRVW